jgi:hypothetical protein
MKWYGWIWMIVLNVFSVSGQEQDLLQILEDQANADDTREMEEDLQQWQHLRRHPLNLNTAGAEELSVFPFLSPLQVQRLDLYRKSLGPLRHVLELQAVPGWTSEIIRKIYPFVTTSITESWQQGMINSLNKGKHQVLTRMGIRKTEGDDFPGSLPSVLLRYQFRSRYLQFAINTEKDMGEQFIQRGWGVAFISSHIALYGKKNPQNVLVIGDYLVNMGQGLVHWQGRAVRKTGMPIMIKRQLPLVQPYRSNDENRFHRGFALVLRKGRWSGGLFLSDKRIDANRKFDSVKNLHYVTSLLTSGYHRTKNELDDKHSLRLSTGGAAIAYQHGGLRVGVNAMHHLFSLPILRDDEPYRLFSFGGKHMANYSVDYHYTFRNVHFFGEAAVNKNFHLAYLQGIMYAVDKKLDLSLLARKFTPRYQAYLGNAFMESSELSNEEGIYAGASLRLSTWITVDTYIDYYRFPWLKFGINIPGWGRDYLIQATWRPDKKTSFYFRFRRELKTENLSASQNMPVSNIIMPNSDPSALTAGRLMLSGVSGRTNVRVYISRVFSSQVEWRVRMDALHLVSGSSVSDGFLFFSDIFWSPGKNRISLNSRIMIYETTDYASRLYAFENDVMYYNIIPSFYGSGSLMYINARTMVGKNFQLFIKGSIDKEKKQPGLSWSARFQVIFSW